MLFRWWKITHRSAETQRLNPGEIRECHEDFLHDDRTQSKLSQLEVDACNPIFLRSMFIAGLVLDNSHS